MKLPRSRFSQKTIFRLIRKIQENKESVQNGSQKEKVFFFWKWEEMDMSEQSICTDERFEIKNIGRKGGTTK